MIGFNQIGVYQNMEYWITDRDTNFITYLWQDLGFIDMFSDLYQYMDRGAFSQHLMFQHDVFMDRNLRLLSDEANPGDD